MPQKICINPTTKTCNLKFNWKNKRSFLFVFVLCFVCFYFFLNPLIPSSWGSDILLESDPPFYKSLWTALNCFPSPPTTKPTKVSPAVVQKWKRKSSSQLLLYTQVCLTSSFSVSFLHAIKPSTDTTHFGGEEKCSLRNLISSTYTMQAGLMVSCMDHW